MQLLADNDGGELKRHEGSRAGGGRTAPASHPRAACTRAPSAACRALARLAQLSLLPRGYRSTKYTALQAYRDMAAKMILLVASHQFVAGKCRVAGLA